MRSLTPHEIPRFVAELAQLGIGGTDGYEARLRSNATCREVLQDLTVEGLVAATLARSGLSVTMSDAPDLDASLDGAAFSVEVKHFRRRPEDDIDDARLRTTIPETGRLAGYGDIPKYAGQVRAVLRKKASTLPTERAAILATYSSSEFQVEHVEVLFARDDYDRDLIVGTVQPGPLNGILHLGEDPALDVDSAAAAVGKNVGYYELPHASPRLPSGVTSALHGIRRRATMAELLGEV